MAVVDATDGAVNQPNLSPGATPFQVVVTVATTNIDNADDDMLLFKFPSPAYLHIPSLWILASDMDTGTQLQFDYGIGDVDGVIDTILINDNTAAQSGAADQVDLTLTTNQGFVDVGGKYLIQTVATAAQTGVAGTVSASGVFYGNLIPYTAS